MSFREAIVGVVAEAASEQRNKSINYHLQQFNNQQSEVGARVDEVLLNGDVKVTTGNQQKTIHGTARQLRQGDVVTKFGGRAW